MNSLNPLFQAELDELEQQEQEERQQFKVDSLDSLNWAFRKLAALEAKGAEVNKLADAEVYRIEDYRRRELEKLERNKEFFQSLISAYAARRREEDPKFKSEKTPYGAISFKKQQPKWSYNDKTLLSWLDENGYDHLIRIKWEPVKTDLKKEFKLHQDGFVVDANGERVEGIEVEFRGDEVVIKPEV